MLGTALLLSRGIGLTLRHIRSGSPSAHRAWSLRCSRGEGCRRRSSSSSQGTSRCSKRRPRIAFHTCRRTERLPANARGHLLGTGWGTRCTWSPAMCGWQTSWNPWCRRGSSASRTCRDWTLRWRRRSILYNFDASYTRIIKIKFQERNGLNRATPTAESASSYFKLCNFLEAALMHVGS